jgi:hypothetical protein
MSLASPIEYTDAAQMRGNAKRQPLIFSDHAIVPLTRGCEAVIDLADIPLVTGWNWTAHSSRRTFYAFRRETVVGGKFRQKLVLMHRLILNAPDGLKVDHINGDGLDNRRENLRLATVAENNRNVGLRSNNTSGIKGVRFHKPHGKWQAQIMIGGCQKHLGYFETAEDARDAYARAAVQFHGHFARTS